MSNRVSAQKSRLKKVQYVADMERKLKALEVFKLDIDINTKISISISSFYALYESILQFRVLICYDKRLNQSKMHEQIQSRECI